MDACGTEDQARRGRGLGNGRAPEFKEWAVRSDVLPDNLMVSSIYIGHTAPFWGPALTEMLPGGVLGIAPGFQVLLNSANSDPRCTTMFVCPRGEEYYNLIVAGVADPFDFWLPERPDLAVVPDRAVVPLDIIEDQMFRHLSRTVRELQAIRIFCPRLRIVRIVPPPPSSIEDVRQWTTARQLAEDPMQRQPTAVKLKLWLLYARMLQSSTADLRLDTLPVPVAATNEIGTLKFEFMGDPIHGNSSYGALVCQQMSALLSPNKEGLT